MSPLQVSACSGHPLIEAVVGRMQALLWRRMQGRRV